MKKILLLISIFVLFPFNVFAYEHYENVTFSAAFDESIDIDKIPEIEIEVDVIPEDKTIAPYLEHIILNKENNFKMEYVNKFIRSEIKVNYVIVGYDVASISYNSKAAVAPLDENNIRVQVVVSPRVINTSSTANLKPFEDIVKEHILDKETVDELEMYSTTKKTTTQVTTDDSGTIIIGQDKTTTTTTTSSDSTSTRLEEIEKEKEENKKKEDFLFKLLIYIILGIILVAGIFVGIKIYKASKLN